MVPAGGVLLLLEFEFEAGPVLVGNGFEVYWPVLPIPLSVVAVDVKVCRPRLDDKSDVETDVLDDGSLEKVVDAADMVNVFPSKVVV
jgi:hypothetical protein